ncbi:MAG TPA: acyl carrier protein [Patescibacteria group bacterium]|nr:acyl carrier protein [Patescibacteria group bacterium]
MRVSENDIRQKIKAYLVRRLRASEKDLSDGQNLFETGVIDSMGAFELATFLEETFGVTFQEEHFFDQRFRSIQGMASLITEIKASDA